MTTGVGLYRSDDGGAHWHRLTGADFRLAYPDHSRSRRTRRRCSCRARPPIPAYGAGPTMPARAIMRSRDGGRHWELLHRGVPETAPCSIEGMTVAAYPGGYSLFIGNTDGEVFASEDGGDPWSRIAGGLGPVSKGNHFVPLQARGGQRRHGEAPVP